MSNTVTRASLRALLEATNGRFFTVAFTKRTTGERRVMNATLHYEGHLVGGDAKYDAREKGLLIVLDAVKARAGEKAIRSIALESVEYVIANGTRYEVSE